MCRPEQQDVDEQTSVPARTHGDRALDYIRIRPSFGRSAQHCSDVDCDMPRVQRTQHTDFDRIARNQDDGWRRGPAKNWAQAVAFDATDRHGCRYHLYHCKSTHAPKKMSASLKEAKFDVAFIDGLHSYEGVRDDIAAYLPLMKRPGGLFIFNDVHNNFFPGVDKALNEFLAKEGLTAHYGTNKVPPGDSNCGVLLN